MRTSEFEWFIQPQKIQKKKKSERIPSSLPTGLCHSRTEIIERKKAFHTFEPFPRAFQKKNKNNETISNPHVRDDRRADLKIQALK